MKESLEEELKQAKKKSAKPMLWISMISMTMLFAGLTSAYVVSRNRDDWVSFDMPDAFTVSTILIVFSSITMILAKRFIQKDQRQLTTAFLIGTLMLGLGFAYFQYAGIFIELNNAGLFFAGEESTVKASFIIGIAFAHLAHIFAGIIVLCIVLYNHMMKKYNSGNFLGLELGGIFWHFVDILWIYLFLFFYFIR
jgi:cytochrome c oxidase subunit 3